MNSYQARYKFMLYNSCVYSCLIIFLFYSCQQSKPVEIKNDQGVVIERYHTIKEKDGEKKHGLYERFDETGKLAEQSMYKNGKLDGTRKLFEKGILEREEMRVEDQYHGPYKEYHPNGNLRMEANYDKDVMTGDVRVYYASGTLKEIVRFADNVESGPFKEYYENGNLKAEGNYKQSDGPVEDGELKLYDSTGILMRIMNCELGKCLTTWKKDTISQQ